ncbi:MAG: triose-phosphate isomerase [Calditrichaeota bacterium]|nr:triose-phosphate isomerase [Calditrichota bacterium]
MSRDLIIAGNWKMNTTPTTGEDLVTAIDERLSSMPPENLPQIVLCPPATHLARLASMTTRHPFQFGAQNVHWAESGAFTGELAPSMILAAGASWAIIGHSERRRYFGETDETVRKRAERALAAGLRPIVCIGETLEERQAGATFDVLRRQLKVGLEGLTLTGKGGLVIAYEPVWAIGTGVNATAGQAEEAHRFIRDRIAEMWNSEIASGTSILYGGSVTDQNASELLACPDVDGALVGGASLKVDQFAGIIAATGAK